MNARPENIERESEIVSQAGRLGAVTVATNMAGRGEKRIVSEWKEWRERRVDLESEGNEGRKEEGK